jgi:hypothetical protein
MCSMFPPQAMVVATQNTAGSVTRESFMVRIGTGHKV